MSYFGGLCGRQPVSRVISHIIGDAALGSADPDKLVANNASTEAELPAQCPGLPSVRYLSREVATTSASSCHRCGARWMKMYQAARRM